MSPVRPVTLWNQNRVLLMYAYPTLGQHPPFRVLCGRHDPYCINHTHHCLPSPNCCEAYSCSSLDKKVSSSWLRFSSIHIDLLGCHERSKTLQTLPPTCLLGGWLIPIAILFIILYLSHQFVESTSLFCSKPLTIKSCSSLVMR